ncbi:MAG: hypothetical protein BWY83_00922 [bacterium ADurb.Bin478]|nr:MAG: hypothetical protein BWY83_00922 [bacterium ADurb.Bin478]
MRKLRRPCSGESFSVNPHLICMMNEKLKQFGDLMLRIRACRSREVALMLSQQIYAEFGKACKSPMARNLLRQNMNDLIRQTFDKNGKNRFLEDA